MRLPTRIATTRIDRKLAGLLGHEEDRHTVFALSWESSGREPIGFRVAYGVGGAASSPSTSG